MAIQRTRSVAIALALSTTIGTLVVVHAAPAYADPGGIVISELNYHAVSDVDGDDFLELSNTSGAAIDVSGWSFSAGVTGAFPTGTVIPANGYLVVGKDAARFQLTYGFAPDAVYGGNLSNSGETVTLIDGALAVIDSVTYADIAPWPTSPDATGPTLELRDLLSDNTLPEGWGASLATGGTPTAVNSINGTAVPPTITEVQATPARPTPNQPVVVSARLKAGSTATLSYKVMFAADVVIPFTDDAASPGGAADGVYAATIPGQAAATLIRYRVDATSGSVRYSSPSADESIHYRGVVVLNSAVTSALPVIEWFMEDAVYDDILANHRQDDVAGAAVWAYNGEVIDGVAMSVRGHSSRTDPKVNWKVVMPAGHKFDLGGTLPYLLDKFALQAYNTPFVDIGWATVRAGGNRALNILPVRTQRNGAFWSLGRLMETEDGSWRTDQHVTNWAIYKGDGGSVGRTASPADLVSRAWLDKKTREDEDFTDVWTLSNAVDAPASAAQQAWLYQNVNIPEMVNYMAINALIRHHDSGWYNWWLARDTQGTGRWEMWQWDLNWIFTVPSADGKGLFLTPDTSNKFTQTMLKYPEIREMYYRRLGSLADQFLVAGRYEAEWEALAAATTPDWNLDRAKWGGYTPAAAKSLFLAGIADRRTAIESNRGPGKLVPVSQSATAGVVINEIQYRPTGSGGEYIELANPSATAVDISGWTIDAVGLTIQAGTVVPAGGRIVFVAQDTAFRAAYTGANRFVGQQFTGTLDDTGEEVTLKDAARIVDTVAYSAVAPWPVAAAGTGPSLELLTPTADNANPANWRAASTTQGTPGLANTPDGAANVVPTAGLSITATGLTVAVNASTSRDSDGSIASYAWTFGDGSSASGVSAHHTYAAAGTFTIGLTVTDNRGATGTASQVVTVAAAPAGILALDSFTRTVTGGLGSAETGGAWTTPDAASALSVIGGVGKLTVPARGYQSAFLRDVSSINTEVRAITSFTRPTASSAYISVVARQVGAADSYAARLVVNAAGRVQLQAHRTPDTVMSSVTIDGLTYATGDKLQVRVQAVGTSPTTIRAKVWKVGTPEPTNWQVTATDSTATLQKAGAVGVNAYVSSTALPTPIVVSYDDFWAGPTN